MMPVDAFSDAALIGHLIDGPPDAACERELARRIALDPALGRLVRRHLMIAEMAEQQALPERSGPQFSAGWEVRVRAEADAAVFTARTMLRIAADPADRRTELAIAGLRLGGLAAAACLLVGLGWGGSRLADYGRRWFAEGFTVQMDNPALAERARIFRELRRDSAGRSQL